LRIAVSNEAGQTVQARQPRITDGQAVARFGNLPPGAYTVSVDGTRPRLVSPVTAAAMVWDPTTT
jgi:hypothetical protein